MRSQTTLLGAAGEHFVVSELLRRGYIGTIAPQGVPNADILVPNIGGARLCSIQVKSRRDIGSDGGWHMNVKHESLHSDKLFYCFVDFGKTENKRPKVYVVPSGIVANVVTSSHKQWLADPGKRGQPHRDSKVRRFLPAYKHIPYPTGWLDKYKDAWHQLGLRGEVAMEP